MLYFCFFKQKTAYEVRISEWSSDVCSSDLVDALGYATLRLRQAGDVGEDWLIANRSLGRTGLAIHRFRQGDCHRTTFRSGLGRLLRVGSAGFVCFLGRHGGLLC